MNCLSTFTAVPLTQSLLCVLTGRCWQVIQGITWRRFLEAAIIVAVSVLYLILVIEYGACKPKTLRSIGTHHVEQGLSSKCTPQWVLAQLSDFEMKAKTSSTDQGTDQGIETCSAEDARSGYSSCLFAQLVISSFCAAVWHASVPVYLKRTRPSLRIASRQRRWR